MSSSFLQKFRGKTHVISKSSIGSILGAGGVREVPHIEQPYSVSHANLPTLARSPSKKARLTGYEVHNTPNQHRKIMSQAGYHSLTSVRPASQVSISTPYRVQSFHNGSPTQQHYDIRQQKSLISPTVHHREDHNNPVRDQLFRKQELNPSDNESNHVKQLRKRANVPHQNKGNAYYSQQSNLASSVNSNYTDKRPHQSDGQILSQTTENKPKRQTRFNQGGAVPVVQKIQRDWTKLGGLGPNLGGEDWLEKKKKIERMQEFSEQTKVLMQNNVQKSKAPRFEEEEPTNSRERAIDYSRNIPRPMPRSQFPNDDQYEQDNYAENADLEQYQQRHLRLKGLLNDKKI